MHKTLLALAAACVLAAPASAQAPAKAQPPAGMPGRLDPARVTGGTYKVDPNHTQVVWSVDHLGFSTLYGMFGQITGTLVLDPARPAAAKLDVVIPLSGLVATSEAFGAHLRTPDMFDAEKFPTARFVSTSVRPQGRTAATITGDLTLHGVTRPVVLQATFTGAGPKPRSGVEVVGFAATGVIKRSDFGLGYGAPAVSDEAKLQLTGSFDKQP